jgi:hypothetical protein
MGRPRKSGERTEDLSEYMKEKILSLYSNYRSYKKVSQMLDMPQVTVQKVVERMRDDYNEMREQMKTEMIQELWGNLIDAQKLGNKYIKEALAGERDIPLNHVSNYFGTMYDKQALMAGDNTQNIGGDGIQVVLNMPDVEDEESWQNKSK